MNTQIRDPEITQNEIEFVKLLSRYFMDFLETDFKKRKWPKRSIKTINSSNLKISIPLYKYPKFIETIHNAIRERFSKAISVDKKEYTFSVPTNVFNLIQQKASQIDSETYLDVLEKIRQKILDLVRTSNNDFVIATSKVEKSLIPILKKEFVVPFVRMVEVPLSKLQHDELMTANRLEEELAQVLFNLIEIPISNIIQQLVLHKNPNILEQIQQNLPIIELKAAIINFFHSLQLGDLTSEIQELKRNKQVLDKQEFYLYFGEINYKTEKFPIFYIPLHISEDNLIEFSSQLYINKKAIEFIAQEYNKEQNQKGYSQIIPERIIYLSNETDLEKKLTILLDGFISFFSLSPNINLLSFQKQTAQGFSCSISNGAYIVLFDKSDEALVNDYEEILDLLSKENPSLICAFSKLIKDFIYTDPTSVLNDLEKEWNTTSIDNKLICKSPIPLNREQRLILNALKQEKCNYVVVKGPPGTGKSHTITAIVCDAILHGKTVLVLSDKKEALDVVEDKIAYTLNKIRPQNQKQQFQNPILRLGKAGSSYSQILNTNTMNQIRQFHQVVEGKKTRIDQEVEHLSEKLKESINKEISVYRNIRMKDLYCLTDLEKELNQQDIPFPLEEFKTPQAIQDLDSIFQHSKAIKQQLESRDAVINLLNFDIKNFSSLEGLDRYFDKLKDLLAVYHRLKEIYSEELACLKNFLQISLIDYELLNSFRARFWDIRVPVFGFLFKQQQVSSLDLEFKKKLHVTPDFCPHKQLNVLQQICDILDFALSLLEEKALTKESYDPISVIRYLLDSEEECFSKLFNLHQSIKQLLVLIHKYPSLGLPDASHISPSLFENNVFANYDEKSKNLLITYLNLKYSIDSAFHELPESRFLSYKETLEKDIIYKMAYQMDGQVLSFYNNHKNKARTLKDIIQTKRKFPKDIFAQLKNAFPCILAGIRDYAEYIPLEPNIFDLIIIDEASQVSIAQAFPALLRAKKVVVLGDEKQFSNVKTSQARTEVNTEYTNRLQQFFTQNISAAPEQVIKLEKFNIKTSILDFLEYISNYSTQLLKHFRGYKELISYSDRFFYQQSLQVMKIRGKSIDDILQFSLVTPTVSDEDTSNTNKAEATFILDKLGELKKAGKKISVGIITPHTDQQKLILQLVELSPDKDFFYSNFHLKVMTFDNCQGEERDLIFYSMVATETRDHLFGVFIKDLSSIDVEVDGKLKAQRLNVGFSRAKEQMHFVISKPLDKFTGSIGEALRYYQNILFHARKEALPEQTDPRSEMEKKILGYLYATDFWQQKHNILEIIPQFNLGKYLAQLDPNCHIPEYRVDFMMFYRPAEGEEQKIIIEYDGFQFHFQHKDLVSAANYEEYYTENDVYRQKVLESYGYKFLRINKFNLGEQPIQTLDSRLKHLVATYEEEVSMLQSNMEKDIEQVQNGEKKVCSKCHNTKPLEDFFDPSLRTQYGRICKACKLSDIKTCPQCGAKMKLRSGKYGPFYGCANYPHCKGIRPYYG